MGNFSRVTAGKAVALCCSKSVPKVDVLDSKRVALRAKVDAPNSCKLMGNKGQLRNHVNGV